MLKNVEWGEYRIGDLFEKINVKKLKYKTNDLPDCQTNEFDLPALTAGIQNQGLNNYVPREQATILKNVISISANGANTGATFYQSKEFTVLQDAYAIDFSDTTLKLSDKQYLFLVGSVRKTVVGKYEWTNKAVWKKIKNDFIKLPTNNNEIDFNFMNEFISLLEKRNKNIVKNYLIVNGLDDCTLTKEELKSVQQYGNIEWRIFNLKELYGEATRGKRLKSDDRIEGDLPFVTAGETEEGVSAFINNDVNIFSPNTTTIDMFGSAKYRNYKYGADDHIAVVHTEQLSKYSAIFVTSSIHKASYTGEFNYGRNFYAKDADNLWIKLPVKNNQPDYNLMENIVSAVHKITIKDLLNYIV